MGNKQYRRHPIPTRLELLIGLHLSNPSVVRSPFQSMTNMLMSAPPKRLTPSASTPANRKARTIAAISPRKSALLYGGIALGGGGAVCSYGLLGVACSYG